MFRRFLGLGVVAAMLAGCGEPESFRFEVHPTSGTVSSKGKPVPPRVRPFSPVGPEDPDLPEGRTGPDVVLTTETDDQGKYVLSTYYADDGVPAGDYIVTVTTSPSAAVDVENGDGRPRPPLSGKFRDPASSPSATVRPGENRGQPKLD
ncbi:MAG: hypothetical protein U0794_19030 [Isosphaeraceae bacterium]